jgi:hypothetical protein
MTLRVLGYHGRDGRRSATVVQRPKGLAEQGVSCGFSALNHQDREIVEAIRSLMVADHLQDASE